MEIVRLSGEMQVTAFNCGDEDLNGFLAEDAYIEAIPFYEKNGFTQLQPLDENKDTRLMYFDMLSLAE